VITGLVKECELTMSACPMRETAALADCQPRAYKYANELASEKHITASQRWTVMNLLFFLLLAPLAAQLPISARGRPASRAAVSSASGQGGRCSIGFGVVWTPARLTLDQSAIPPRHHGGEVRVCAWGSTSNHRGTQHAQSSDGLAQTSSARRGWTAIGIGAIACMSRRIP